MCRRVYLEKILWGDFSWEMSWGGIVWVDVQILVQYYTSLRIAVMICVVLVNTHRQIHRETAVDQPYY